MITIVVPQFVPRQRWHNLLHAQTAMLLRLALLFKRGIVITSVPYQVGEARRSSAMYMIVVGCGRVGVGARRCCSSRRGHEVTVIDHVGSSFSHLDPA